MSKMSRIVIAHVVFVPLKNKRGVIRALCGTYVCDAPLVWENKCGIVLKLIFSVGKDNVM